MKNHSKMTLILLGLMFLTFFVNSVSAYSYYSDDSFYYKENVDGAERGFSINFKDEDAHPVNGYTYCGYYDWTYDGRKCAKSSYGAPYYQNDAYASIDHNAVLKEAFKTYQQNSKYEYQLESQKLSLANRRYYGGYGSGYSGVRYYRYGW